MPSCGVTRLLGRGGSMAIRLLDARRLVFLEKIFACRGMDVLAGDMRTRRLVHFFSLGVALAGVLGGCSRRERPVDAGIRTHTLLLGNQNEPATLDPHLINAATDMNVAAALFEGLTCYDEKT